MRTDDPTSTPGLLTARSVRKRFGAVVALRDASLDVAPGEIRALLGANGSGKSTLVKVLGGLVAKDGGHVALDGRHIEISGPRQARAHGIAVAYQDLSLIPRLTVADNVSLGNEPRRALAFADRRGIYRVAEEVLGRLEARFPPDALVSVLDASELAQLEIAKALACRPRHLLLDEVTASLHRHQVEVLFSLLRELRQEGTGILFVSHRLDEVFELCDAATVLRGGEAVASVRIADVDHAELAFLMTGKRVGLGRTHPAGASVPRDAVPLLVVDDLHVPHRVRGASIRIGAGEVVGLAGLHGQGQSELLRAIHGAIPFTRGRVQVAGVQVDLKSPADAVRHGIGFVPGDRDRDGVLPARSVEENLFLAKMASGRMARRIRPGALRAGAKEMIEKLDIVAGGPGHPARSLSGGNQQKLVVGRWLAMDPAILILDDPTKGVDIGAREEIHGILRSLADKGTGILIASSDSEELLALADRICVVYEGAIVAELRGDQRTEERLVAAMLGVEGGPGGRVVP